MSEAKHTSLIAMQENLGLGHKGNILITTKERVNNNYLPIADQIINIEWANKLCLAWNNHDELVEALKAMMNAWIQPTIRSMHQLKIDMDKAYEQTKTVLDKIEGEK